MAKKTTNKLSWNVILDHEKMRQGLTRVQETQKTWRDAIRMAEQWNNPLRYQLYRVYDDVMLFDAHIKAAITNRKKRLEQLEFELIDNNGVANPELVLKLKKIWFKKLIGYFIDTQLYGHSLLVIESIVDNNIMDIELIDREYVSPETGLLLDNYHSLSSGYNFRDKSNKDNDFLVEIGEEYDLGLLATLSPLALFKKSDMQFWALFIEMYGIPYRIGKVKSERPEDRQAMQKHLMNMGAAGYSVLSNTDEIETLENNGSANNSDFFKEFLNYLNGEISKLLLGATGTIDGLQSGTQAQSSVHQLQLDVITKADVMDFEYFFNEEFMPKLVQFNVLPEGFSFKFKSPERIAQQFIKADLDAKVMSLAQSNVFDVEYLKKTYDYMPNENKPVE